MEIGDIFKAPVKAAELVGWASVKTVSLMVRASCAAGELAITKSASRGETSEPHIKLVSSVGIVCRGPTGGPTGRGD
jgi:hypothetical protein